jgi:hypothetical protein
MPILVNDNEITDEQVFREMQHHPATDREAAMQMAAEALTIRELLLQAFVREGLGEREVDEEGDPLADDGRIQSLLDKMIQVPAVTEEDTRRYFENNKASFAARSGSGEPLYEDMREAITAFLSETSWRTATQQYIKILAGRARLAGIDLEAADSPLVR